MKYYLNSRNYVRLFWLSLVTWLCLFAWAFFFEIDKSVTVRGVLQPFGKSFDVESGRDGKIIGIDVGLGERVSIGQTIIRLDTDLDQLNFASLQKQIILGKLKYQRFQSLVNSEVQFPTIMKDHIIQWTMEQNNFDAAREAFILEVEIIEKEIQVSTARIVNINETIQSAMGQRTLLEKQKALINRLYEKGFEGELSLLEVSVKLESFEEQVRSLERSTEEEMLKIQTFNKRLDSLHANFKNKAQRGLYEASVELSELQEKADTTIKKIEKSDLNSPVNGRLSKFIKNNLGLYVSTGESVATIVPDGVPLMLYIKVPVEHISSVKIGQPVKIALDNVDNRTSAKATGRLIQLNGDTTTLENGERFFEGVVEPLDVPERYSVPGVDGTVSLLTGKQSVIEFFLEPVLDTLQSSFGE
ncbi:HlyD family efflux transporter periplasmic adaptor subunit [Ascidiaceihabitans sp.]|nr:HlyD family efflux transporter periplasmic adaptor subunit [Ascidiaceihabitans sp.]